MKVHCDHCGHELEEAAALIHQSDGELFYFCDKNCKARCKHLTPVDMPDQEDRGIGSEVPVTDDD